MRLHAIALMAVKTGSAAPSGLRMRSDDGDDVPTLAARVSEASGTELERATKSPIVRIDCRSAKSFDAGGLCMGLVVYSEKNDR